MRETTLLPQLHRKHQFMGLIQINILHGYMKEAAAFTLIRPTGNHFTPKQLEYEETFDALKATQVKPRGSTFPQSLFVDRFCVCSLEGVNVSLKLS